MTESERAYAVGKKYEAQKKAVGRPEKLAQNALVKGTTEKRLAEKHGMDESTVKRAAEFARGVDPLDEAVPGMKSALEEVSGAHHP